MTPKDILLQELDNTSDPLIIEVLNFLQFLKSKREQPEQTAVAALNVPTLDSPNEHPALSDYPLQGKEPYRYEDPFAPAIPSEEWDVLQ